MVLQKTWTNREFFFWAAASSWLLARSHAENTPERNLFGTLAYKMVMKARNDTPMDTKVLPARAIQTVQEVHLLVAIVRDYGTDKIAAAKEALNILESKNLGVDSEIGKGDWWGLVRLRLDVLEDLSEWTKEREVCKELLAGSVEGVKEGEKTGKGDDWRVWEGLLKATEAQLKAGGSKEYADKLLVDTKQVIENHMKVDKKSRNVLLAGCYYAGLVDSKDKAKRESEAPELLEKVEKYFEQWGTKNCCFEDIRLYTEQLNEKAQAAFLKFVAEKVKKLKADANDVVSPLMLEDANNSDHSRNQRSPLLRPRRTSSSLSIFSPFRLLSQFHDLHRALSRLRLSPKSAWYFIRMLFLSAQDFWKQTTSMAMMPVSSL